MFKPEPPAHRVLPREVQQQLIDAASIEPGTPVGGSRARTRAIDEVISTLKWKYPQLFNHNR